MTNYTPCVVTPDSPAKPEGAVDLSSSMRHGYVPGAAKISAATTGTMAWTTGHHIFIPGEALY